MSGDQAYYTRIGCAGDFRDGINVGLMRHLVNRKHLKKTGCTGIEASINKRPQQVRFLGNFTSCLVSLIAAKSGRC